ncbi:MAG: O-antigen ligase family protein [Rhizobiales bacterium]|nr:O-antigen ligase family protein [Hyphomicrobiales bacterium]
MQGQMVREWPLVAGFSAEQIRNGLVWLMFAVSFVVFVEPAPVDVMFLTVLVGFFSGRFNPSISIMPLIMMLIVYNIGGIGSFFAETPDPKAVMFVITSFYMALSAMVIALYVSEDTDRRFNIIRSGLIVGGTIAAILGLLDYFQVGGLFRNTPLPGRATGAFKDPNVFSTYLILPAMMIIQGLIAGTFRRPVIHLCILGLLALAIFLSFSRGAWVNFFSAAVLVAGLSFIFPPRRDSRMRVVFLVVGAIFVGFIGFSLIMSIPSTREMFIQRFALVQYYDAGETGRFGNQLRSIPALMVSPLGFGPLNFNKIYGQDPHNTFVNAFASYGWLGGVTYFTLILSTIYAGVRSIWIKTPWQGPAIAVFAPTLTTILQGIQIDTDHWRHFYWLIGLTWGFFALSTMVTSRHVVPPLNQPMRA